MGGNERQQRARKRLPTDRLLPTLTPAIGGSEHVRQTKTFFSSTNAPLVFLFLGGRLRIRVYVYIYICLCVCMYVQVFSCLAFARTSLRTANHATHRAKQERRGEGRRGRKKQAKEVYVCVCVYVRRRGL